MERIPVRHGGLMRCCLATLDEDTGKRTELPSEETVLTCRFCKNPMRFRNGGWEWARDIALKDEPWAKIPPTPARDDS